MRKETLLIYIVLSLAVIALVSNPAKAQVSHITLLTVGEAGAEIYGGTADAYLEIKPGTGRIFLDSFPLTKLDTQISTRYANKIACDYLDMPCDDKDFFYTIRADSTIVGGPSASGPLTVLTVASLKDITLRNDTVMTGTINSGGSIGPVGGIVQKAEAAQKAGFKKVLIPMFTINTEENPQELVNNFTIQKKNISNDTSRMNQTPGTPAIDIISRIGIIEEPIPQKNLSIKIIKIRNLDEALSYFTDQKLIQNEPDIIVPKKYNDTMKSIASSLCKRAFVLRENLDLNESEQNQSDQISNKIKSSYEDGDYYSSASYCFNLGVLLRKKNLKEIESKNPSRIASIKEATERAVLEFDRNLEAKNLTTISDLETYIIVKERILESEESLAGLTEDISTDELAYAIERYYSGVFWSEFFNINGKPVKLDESYLEEACNKKLSEAEERINYAGLYLPSFTQGARDSLSQAYAFAEKKNYKMCLFKASFAKAESNLLLSSISVNNDLVDSLSQEKINASRKIIAKEERRGFFPIMGYSYYEYSDSLRRNNDSISGLIFSEYALELSNVEIYFPKKGFRMPYINYSQLELIVSVFALGFAVGMISLLKLVEKRERKQALPASKSIRKKKK